MGAILQYGLSVTLVGIGTVFVGLIILIALIKLMEKVMNAATGKQKAAAPAPAAAPAGATTVNSPMPGTIVDVKVAVGQTVKNGDLVAILEAMKMENEIFAPCDGKIVAVNASKGATVNTGDAIVSIQ